MKKMPIHIVIDTREQTPFTFKDGFDPLPIVSSGTLRAGDYTVKGYEPLGDFDEAVNRNTLHHRFAIERKSPQDFINCLGNGRKRYSRELYRAWKSCFRFAVVVECPLSALIAGHYRGALNPNCIIPSVLSIWLRWNIPTFFFKDAKEAEIGTYNLLRLFIEQRTDEAQEVIRAMEKQLDKDWTEVEAST